MTSDSHGPLRHDKAGYVPSEGTYHVLHDWEDPTPVSYTLLTAIGAITGKEVTELTPLTEIVDPDALDKLFDQWRRSQERTDAHLSFRFNRCAVTVRSTGKIVIEPPVE